MSKLATAAIVLCAASAPVWAHDPQTPSSIEHIPLERVSPHIYVVQGTQELPNPDSRGFMNNPAAVLADNGVIIIDPGSSVEIGRELLKKVREVSDKPVIAVFNTHVHGDHWLGNQAIRERYPEVPIYAHERMIERVNAGEGEGWIRLFKEMTGNAIDGTRVVGPNVGLDGGEVLNLDGITLRIHHVGPAHTDHDLMIEVIDDAGLFFGDIVAEKRVPNSDVPQDASFKGSVTAIRTMLDGTSELFIPGHGRSGGRETPEASLRFLEELLAAVTKYYEQGLADYEMKEQVSEDLAEFSDWHNFDQLGKVISHVYQEIEAENF
jgi:glyoxylase-like metal-dependent hydrolase (beta-lactamase superfamily II)